MAVLIFYLQNSNDFDEDKGYVNGGMLDNELVIWCMCHWIFQSERFHLVSILRPLLANVCQNLGPCVRDT